MNSGLDNDENKKSYFNTVYTGWVDNGISWYCPLMKSECIKE